MSYLSIHRARLQLNFYAAWDSLWARSLFQSVAATTVLSASEFDSKIFAAFVPLKPKTIGIIHELAAKTLSIFPCVLKGITGLIPKR